MKNQCTNLRKEVQEEKKSIRGMKTTLEIFKGEMGRGRKEEEGGRDERETETENAIRDMTERLGGNYIT